MGTKEEPIYVSDSEDVGDTESCSVSDITPTIMINSSSDEEENGHINNRTNSVSRSKLKFDVSQLNFLKATLKINKLNPNRISPRKSNTVKTNSTSSSNHSRNIGHSPTSNGLGYNIYKISDDEGEPEEGDSKELGIKVEVKTEFPCEKNCIRPTTSSDLDKNGESLHHEEGLFQKVERLVSSGRVSTEQPQNDYESNFKRQNIEKFFTPSPKKETSSPRKEKPSSSFSCSKTRQTTFESLSPNKKLFTPLPNKRPFQALPLIPPLHSAMNLSPSGFYKGFFTESQMNSIEAVEEEGLYEVVLNSTLHYMSRTRAPPPQLVFRILSKILLNSKKAALTMLACLTLKRIHMLHPSSTDMHKCGLNWDFVTSVVEMIELSGCSHKQSEKSDNASLVFGFILYILEKECQRKLFSSMRKCLAFKLLSLKEAFRNVHNVLQWIREAINHHSSDTCVHSLPFNSTNANNVKSVLAESSANLPCPLILFQHLLQLVMIVNDKNPKDCARQLADELVSCYLSLHNLNKKILLLQTIESHLVKFEMIDSVLESRFPMEDFSSTGLSLPTGLHKVFDRHFFHELQYGDVDSSGDKDVLKQECEEFVTLLAYLMQSYICVHEEKLQASKDTPFSNFLDEQDSLNSDCNGLHLSVEDVVLLCDVDEHVDRLQQRLEKICPIFSERTYLMFKLMKSLSSFTR